MRFEKDKSYKLVEFDSGLLITEVDNELKSHNAQPLMIGQAAHILAYLDRYFFERAHMRRSMADAHPLALKSAQIERMIVKKKP